MLLRPGGIPAGDGWAFELKYDGFRAIVSTEDGLQIRSRRAWNMSDRVPELRELPPGLVLDGELVASTTQARPTGRSSSSGCCTGTPRSRSRSSRSTDPRERPEPPQAARERLETPHVLDVRGEARRTYTRSNGPSPKTW